MGNGKSISVWSEKWIVDKVLRLPLMKNIIVDLELKVCELLDPVSRIWRIDKLKELFYDEDIQRIMKMKPVVNEEDFRTWVHNRNRFYSVRSGYWLYNQLNMTGEKMIANAQPSLNTLTESVWKVETSPKIRTFMWRALSNAIPAGEFLQHRGINLDPCCQLCGFQGESPNHILFSCTVARQVWALSNIPVPEGGFSETSLFSNYYYLIELAKNNRVPKILSGISPESCGFYGKTRTV